MSESLRCRSIKLKGEIVGLSLLQGDVSQVCAELAGRERGQNLNLEWNGSSCHRLRR